MGRGGARANSGPAPDPNALRRDRPSDKASWITLPAAGRAGPPPEWPLVTSADEDVAIREHDLWRSLWRRPQAVMWAALGQELEVALFVRKLAEAERPRASVELQKVIRQYLGSLGLSVEGMLRNRWKIDSTAPSASASRPTAPKPAQRTRGRDRFTVIDGDDDGKGA